jgi:outer membrane protein OmpA-like peptidoglycan-associated protein
VKYSMMTALSLVLGGGLVTAAYADQPDPYQQSQNPQNQPQTQTQTQNQAAPPATPQAPQATPQATTPQNKEMNGHLTGKGTATGEKDVSEVAPVDLLFDFDSAALSPNARADLETVAVFAKCQTKGAIILEGHADPRGTQAYNMQLSGARAAAVRQKLIQMGFPSDRIVVTLYGENGPQRASFAEDRRVTIRAAESPVQPSEVTAQK